MHIAAGVVFGVVLAGAALPGRAETLDELGARVDALEAENESLRYEVGYLREGAEQSVEVVEWAAEDAVHAAASAAASEAAIRDMAVTASLPQAAHVARVDDPNARRSYPGGISVSIAGLYWGSTTTEDYAAAGTVAVPRIAAVEQDFGFGVRGRVGYTPANSNYDFAVRGTYWSAGANESAALGPTGSAVRLRQLGLAGLPPGAVVSATASLDESLATIEAEIGGSFAVTPKLGVRLFAGPQYVHYGNETEFVYANAGMTAVAAVTEDYELSGGGLRVGADAEFSIPAHPGAWGGLSFRPSAAGSLLYMSRDYTATETDLDAGTNLGQVEKSDSRFVPAFEVGAELVYGQPVAMGLFEVSIGYAAFGMIMPRHEATTTIQAADRIGTFLVHGVTGAVRWRW